MRKCTFIIFLAAFALAGPACAATQNPPRPVMLSEKAEQCTFLDSFSAGKRTGEKRRGQYVPKSYDDAFRWCLDAAGQGIAAAQAAVGDQYAARKDYTSAARWLNKAAQQGDAGAQLSLGKLFQQGLGVQKSDAAAFFWYVVAANAGNDAAAAPRDEVWANLSEEQASAVFAQVGAWKPHPDISRLRKTP